MGHNRTYNFDAKHLRRAGDLIDRAGGSSRAAELLGVSASAVMGWRRKSKYPVWFVPALEHLLNAPSIALAHRPAVVIAVRRADGRPAVFRLFHTVSEAAKALKPEDPVVGPEGYLGTAEGTDFWVMQPTE